MEFEGKMSQKEKPNLAAALASASGSTRRRPESAIRPVAPRNSHKRVVAAKQSGEKGSQAYHAPSRSGTAPITGHFPRQVRDQLKILAIEQKQTLHGLMAEAYNDLFAKYGKPEIAPRQAPAEESQEVAE
jgi:hypothetical protein